MLNKSLSRLTQSALILSIAMLTSCVMEQFQEEPQEELHEVVFHAGWDGETKTVLQEDGSVYWSPGDEISLFVGSGENGGYKFTATNADPSAKVDFIGHLGEMPEDSKFIAIYPYNEDARADGNFLQVTIPQVQVAREETFDPKSFISVAVSSNDNLYFRNVCSGIKFNVENDDITKIRIIDPFKGGIAGPVNVSLDEDTGSIEGVFCPGDNKTYYIDVYPSEGMYFKTDKYYYVILKPGEYWDGIEISYFKETEKATLALYGGTEFTPSVFKRVYKKDAELSFAEFIPETYGVIAGSPYCPNARTIKTVNVYTNDDTTTDYHFYAGLGNDLNPVVYWDADETTFNIYTSAEKIKVIDAGNLFYDFRSLTYIDLSDFDFSSCSNFSGMFSECHNLETVDFSSVNTSLATNLSFMFQNCRKLYQLDLSNFDTQNVNTMQGMFTGCSNLEKLNIGSFDASHLSNITRMFYCCYSLTGIDMGLFDLSKVSVYDVACQDLAKYSKICAIRCSVETRDFILKNCGLEKHGCDKYVEFFGPEDTMPDYQKIVDPNLYYSQDFSMDKEVKLIHKATKGNGINIAFLGDAYSDRLIKDGTYDADMSLAIDAVFSEEPYKSYKDLFNIYQIYTVSVNEEMGENTVFEVYPDENVIMHWSSDMIKEYIASIPDIESIYNVPLMVVVNTNEYSGAAGHEWGLIVDGGIETVAYQFDISAVLRNRGNDESFIGTVNHEFGHCFGYLADEYIGPNSLEEWQKTNITRIHQYDMELNIDITDNPETIIWNQFLKDTRYSNENLGIFQGGYNSYSTDVWRPSENSIMRHNYGGFNAPSREAIYKRIHKLAFGPEWQYDYETFVQQDIKNIQPAATETASANNMPYPARVEEKPLYMMEEHTTPDGKRMVKEIMN